MTLECTMWLENYMLLGSFTYLALWVGAWSEKVAFSLSPTPWFVILQVWYLRDEIETAITKSNLMNNLQKDKKHKNKDR